MSFLLAACLLLTGASTVAMATTNIPSQAMVIGDGYNILYGNPDGVQWQSGGQDPGIRIARKVLQIETDQEFASEVSYQSHDKCQESRLTQIVYSPHSYQQKLLKRITFDGQQVPNLQATAFSLSNGYHYAKDETTDHHHVFFENETTCVTGSARYKMSLVQPDEYKLTNEIIADICALPETNDTRAYKAFIDKWGTNTFTSLAYFVSSCFDFRCETRQHDNGRNGPSYLQHVITEVQLGKRQTERYRLTAGDFLSSVMKKAPSDVSMGSDHSYKVDVDSVMSQLSSSDSIGQLYGTLQTGSDMSPEPVSLGLTSIDEVFSSKFWQGIEDIFLYCPNNITSILAVKRVVLQQALQQYSVINGGQTPSGFDLTVPMRWPTGTYGLPKSVSGCPNEKGVWAEGWLRQQPETKTPNSEWTTPNHFDGTLSRTLFLLRFCVKTVESDGLSMDWPKGDYCIFKYHMCPPGFAEGYVQWDDENTNNSNAHGGTLPNGDYGSDTLMRYCCRSDGNMYDPIVLPTDNPFYLFQYKHGCQEVSDMTSSVEELTWDDDDTQSPSRASIGSVHPGMKFCNPPNYPGCGTASHIYYCYYRRSDSGATAIIG